MRFSLKWMLGAVALVGFACVALYNANEVWAMGTMALIVIVLLVAVLGAFHSHSRAFYSGMAVFGWSYLFLNYLPPMNDSIRPLAAVNALLDIINNTMQREIPVSPNALHTGHKLQLSAAGLALLERGQKTSPVSRQKAPNSARIIVNRGPTGFAYSMPFREHFRAIGHSLFALVFAIIGGVVGQWFARSREAKCDSA